MGRKMRSNKKISAVFISLFIMLLSEIAAIGVCDRKIPDITSVFEGEEISASLSLPGISFSEIGENKVSADLFGVLRLKSVSVGVLEKKELCPGGMPFGVKMTTKGLPVVGLGSVETEKGRAEPAKKCGIRVGDIIEKVEGEEVETVGEFTGFVDRCGGKALSVDLLRGSERLSVFLTPAFSLSDNGYRAGLWLRDSTAGIGTVTYIDPTDRVFGGLGHGICDVDTGALLPIREGTAVGVVLNGVTRGTVGTPGELRGYFMPGSLGSVFANTGVGIFGRFDSLPASLSDPMPVGLRRDVTEGEATLLCTVGDSVENFSLMISDIDRNGTDSKNFVIRITDPRLIEKTGGIVQGMSGSPILQNGKLIGAVTHVLVNDPTKGYGIFLENMLEQNALLS